MALFMTSTPKFVGALVLAASLGSAQASLITEVEPNDTFGAGQNVGAHDGSLSITGVRTNNNDDFFRFQATAGDVITLETFDLGAITFFDSILELLDPSGMSLAIDDDSGVGFASKISNFAISGTGLYAARVTGFFLDDAFNYRLDVSGLTPTAAAIPEPGSLALAGLALTALVAMRRRKR